MNGYRASSAQLAGRGLSRLKNLPKSGLASPNHAANLAGLVLGCFDASDTESRLFRYIFEISSTIFAFFLIHIYLEIARKDFKEILNPRGAVPMVVGILSRRG